jgi:hypothetical protein
MADVADNFKINLNQNVWLLVVSLLGLGLSEYFHLPKLMGISYALSLISAVSVFFTLLFYTIRYCKAKMAK